MGSYATTQWQHGDEITSTKLQQMSFNDTWLKDNALVGRNRFPTGTDGKFALQRTAGNFKATKLEVSSRWLDTHTPVKYVDLGYAIPEYFTEDPVCLVTLEMPQDNLACNIVARRPLVDITIRIFNTDNVPRLIGGNVNVLMFGN